MGRLAIIECLINTAKYYEREDADEYIDFLKEQYENHLKDDMVDMLEDLKQDFIAEAYGIEMDCTDYVVNVADIDKIIQQKINELKENTDGLNEKTSN